MPNRKHPEDHDNHDRWLVSYADFITLLFAFFVVMYSVSHVNEGKYKVLSGSLEAAFKSEQKNHASEQADGSNASPAAAAISVLNPGGASPIDTIFRQIETQIKPLADQGLITLRHTDEWLEIEINNRILFPSGSTKLLPDARMLLSLLGEVLGKFNTPVQVEGYTDNVPINTPVYPSNWELSAARAASVTHLLANQGVSPELLAAVGYGETRPLTGNGSAEGRSQNRRVVLKIFKTGRSNSQENDNSPPAAISAPPAAGVTR